VGDHDHRVRRDQRSFWWDMLPTLTQSFPSNRSLLAHLEFTYSFVLRGPLFDADRQTPYTKALF
jgi:hypothetical protein